MEHGNIAAGYRTDLNNLINKFEQKKSARYSDFVQTWHELEFWRLCYGRKLEHDKAEFMEDIFQITVEYLSSSNFEAIVVITALYTLNGLWHCQRMVNKHRIRLSYRQYQQLDQFAKQMAAQGHTDFFAVYKRMLLERAFDIAIFTSPFMLGQFWKLEPGEQGDVDEVSGHIMDDEFHQFSSASVLDRLTKRCEPAFATYQAHQTKLLRDLPPDQEPIEFAKNVSPAGQLGDTCAKIAQLEHQLSGVDLELKYNDLGTRRRRIRERAMERGTSSMALALNDSDMSISPTKQVALTDEINRETEFLDSYKPKYVLNQAAPKSVQRLKRGRPFVKGVEEREYSQTDFRGGIFKVAGPSKRERSKKRKKRGNNQGDSGISSPGSVEQEHEGGVEIVSRIEQYVDNQLAPLKKQIENEERAERIKQHMEELEQAQKAMEAKKMSQKKKEEMRKRMIKAKKQLEKKKAEIENGEVEEEPVPTKRGKRRIGKNKEKLTELKPIKEEDIVASIKKEVEEESDSDDDKPLALMAPPKKKKKTPVKKAKLTDLKKLNEDDYIMVDPVGLDHSMLPETRPLLAQIVEVNREDEYIEARWMRMKTSSIGKMLYEYSWQADPRHEHTQLCIDDLFEKVDLRKGNRLSAAQSRRCASYYPDYEFD